MHGRLYVVPTGPMCNRCFCVLVKEGCLNSGESAAAQGLIVINDCGLACAVEIGYESYTPLQGLDHVMFVAATGNRLLLRQYAIAFKKSGAQVPRTELAEIGPRIDFSIRRSRAAPDEIQTQSMKQPKLDKKKVSLHCQVAIKL